MNTKANVFVSYSHTDLPLVVPIVSLLRANSVLVFRDADSIGLGKRWRREILTAIAEANLVVVFWCLHASSSVEVIAEYTEAVNRGKDVLPLLLDETPLHPMLREFQWLDFREVMGANHATLGRRSSTYLLLAIMVFLASLIIIIFPIIKGTESVPSDPWNPAMWVGLSRLWWFSVVVALGAAALGAVKSIVLLLRRILLPQQGPVLRSPVILPSRNSKTQKLLAKAIETEILRRTAD